MIHHLISTKKGTHKKENQKVCVWVCVGARLGLGVWVVMCMRERERERIESFCVKRVITQVLTPNFSLVSYR